MSEKQYGLILPKKKAQVTPLPSRPLTRAFDSGDELESEEECPLNWIEATLKKSAGNASQKATQKRILRDALREDSTIFQYDEVYNDIKATQNAKQAEKKQRDKPKYITTILKQAEKRKLNFERLRERKVQKEREAEGDEFADKESFVTPSYLKKLDEIKKAEEDEARQKILEEKNDLLKHKNFAAFYSHIYQQKVGGDIEVKKEPPDEEDPHQDGTQNALQEEQGSPLQGSSSQLCTPTNFKKENYSNRNHKTRHYRNRSSSRSPKRKNITRKTSSSSDSSSPPPSPDRIRKKRKDHHSSHSPNTTRSSSPTSPHSERKGINGKTSNPEKEKRSSKRSSIQSSLNEKVLSKSNKAKDPSSLDKMRNHVKSKRYSGSEEDASLNSDASKGIKQEKDSPPTSPAKESRTVVQNAHSKNEMDCKIEDAKQTKESRLERIRKLFTKRTQGTLFDDAVARYFVRVSQREVDAKTL